MSSKAERKRQRQADQMSAARHAENWQDREGKARPTPERRAKGVFVLRDGDDAGVTVAVDEAVTMLDQLRRNGTITDPQCQAGHDFAAMLNRMQMVSPGRSCLDFTPVGYEGDHDPTHAELRDKADRIALFAKCSGPWVWAELRRVCYEHDKPKHMPSLISGLNMCADYWGLQDAKRNASSGVTNSVQ